MWVVMGVLAFTVVSSFILLVLATRNPPQLAVEDYTRIAEISAAERSRDRRARELGLSLALDFTARPDGSRRVTARIGSTAAAALPDRLVLRARHLTSADRDAEAVLTGSSGIYEGTVELDDSGYELVVEDLAASWRLRGRIAGLVSRLELQASPAPGG
jgi:hypothetical protein